MSDCERLSERMPGIAAGTAAWTTGEAAHLEACADCRAEWELVLGARRLEGRAPAVDVEAVAAAVQRRLSAERRGRRRARWLWAVGGSAVAAAAAILIAVNSGDVPARRPAPTAALAEAVPLMPLPELEGLETAQLDTLLRVLDGTLAGSTEPSVDGEDVEAELDRIFATWEG